MPCRIVDFGFNDKELIEKAFFIRFTVFVEEQKVDPKLEMDEFDEVSAHYLAYINGLPVGTARLRKTGEGVKLERFAVLKEYRNMNIGKALLDRMLVDTVKMNRPVYLYAQITALKFYLKNGFEAVGETFYEAGIEHVKMILLIPEKN